MTELGGISGVGAAKLERYGAGVLATVSGEADDGGEPAVPDDAGPDDVNPDDLLEAPPL